MKGDATTHTTNAAYRAGWERTFEVRLVHNHGPEDGPGLACLESMVDGRLVGDCLRGDKP